MPLRLKELGIDQLSVRERLDLIEQIWDSLPEEVGLDELPDWHKEVLAKRLAEAEANPDGGVPWKTAWPRSGLVSHEPAGCPATLGQR